MTPRIPRSLLVPAYAVGVAGAFLQISGGIWDVSAHIEEIPETFFTPQHMVLYTGVALSLLASTTGILLRLTAFRDAVEKPLLTGLSLALVGGGFQLAAGPLDFQWHQQFGFDPFLFTPAHSLLIVGIILNGIGMAVGTSRLLHYTGPGLNLASFSRTKLLPLLSVVSFSTLWLVLNGLVYLVTDAEGIGYTFGLGDEWVQQANPVAIGATWILLAGTGTLVLLGARRVLPWKGSLSIISVITAVVTLMGNLGFRAAYLFELGDLHSASVISSFIPLYILFLVPIVAFDFLVAAGPGRRKALVTGAVLGPFVSFLDGFYSLVFWTGGTALATEVFATGRVYLIVAFLLPMAVVGSLASLARHKFVAALVSSSHAVT